VVTKSPIFSRSRMFIYCGQYKNWRGKYSTFLTGQQRIWYRSIQRKPKTSRHDMQT